MGNFFAELRRRHIYRIGAVYVVVAWGIIQVLDVLSQLFALPDWIAQPAVVVLAIGFPVTLVAAWMIVGATDSANPARSLKATGTDWLIGGGLIAVLAFLGYQQFASTPLQITGVETAREAATSPDTAVAVAALPFANLSGDPNQESFADGITDEIVTALARIPDLQVVARRSAYQFKGQNADVQTIGEALGATHLVDGTVRREGDRVRITAQLIDVETGAASWDESYDRVVEDIFAIQEEIATAIAGVLNMQLGLAPGETLVLNRIENLDAYDQLLRARAFFHARGIGVAQAIDILEPLVEANPEYASAWALLANAYWWAPVNFAAARLRNFEAVYQEYNALTEIAAREAIALDSRQSSAYAALGAVHFRNTDWEESEDLLNQALALDPNDPETLHLRRHTLSLLGRLSEAVQVSEHLESIEPLVPVFNGVTAQIKLTAGNAADALEIANALGPDESFPEWDIPAVEALAEVGRFEEAAQMLARYTVPVSQKQLKETAVNLLANAPTIASEPLPNFERTIFVFVYAYIGHPERLIDQVAREFNEHSALGSGEGHLLWSSLTSSVRETERFKTLVRSSGLLDYWRARGWPDLCRPVGEDDFECD